MQEEKSRYVVPSVTLDEDKRATLVNASYMLDEKLLKEPLRNKYTINALDVDSFTGLR